MIGDAVALAIDVPVPLGVTVRRVAEEPDVRAMSAMQCEVFGDRVSEDAASALDQRLSLADGLEVWVGEAAGQIVSAGRLEPVASSDFAGIGGGATRADRRGSGTYRAVTAARAHSAISKGKDTDSQ